MEAQKDSLPVRLECFGKKAFAKDVYCPGVLSPARLLWGSIGAGLTLLLLTVWAEAADIEIILPPLAASCFITAACVHLRVARPKSVIVGHFVSALGGAAGAWAGRELALAAAWQAPVALGLALFAASALMQVFDSDHPPAAATAVIPVLMPLAVPWYIFALHMAWAATLIALISMTWNRIFFGPAAGGDSAALPVRKAGPWGLVGCGVGAILMSGKTLHIYMYFAGLACLGFGVLLAGAGHFGPVLSFPRSKGKKKQSQSHAPAETSISGQVL